MTFPDVFFSHYDDVSGRSIGAGISAMTIRSMWKSGWTRRVLVSQAHNSPERNFVGLEQDWPRLKKAMQKIDALRQGSPTGHWAIFSFESRCDRGAGTPFCQRSIHRIFVSSVSLAEAGARQTPPVFSILLSCSTAVWLSRRRADRYRFRPFFEWIHAEADGTGFAATTRPSSRSSTPNLSANGVGKVRRSFELQIVKKEHRDIPVAEDADMKAYFCVILILTGFNRMM